jgi:hypothetical protein
MEYNLLQKIYDLQCELFINGFIEWIYFEELEKKYLIRKKTFTICLN